MLSLAPRFALFVTLVVLVFFVARVLAVVLVGSVSVVSVRDNLFVSRDANELQELGDRVEMLCSG